MKVSEYAVKHPAVIGMLLIVLGVFGFLSLSTLNIEFMGDISMPSVIVISVYPGASAEDIEEDVTKVLEDDFVTLPDFKSVSSESSNSVSVITITFRDKIDPNDKLTEVRDRVNRLMEDLPDGISGVPNVVVGGASMLPIITFSVNGGSDAGSTTEYINETLRPRLTSVPGVSDVEINGGQDPRVNIMLRLADLEARKISAATVYQILNYSNVSLPAGNAIYEGRSIAVRYSGELSSLEDIRELPVGSADNKIIRLSDVADITLGYPDETSHVTDGKNSALIVEVKKRSDGNTMGIAKQVKKILHESSMETSGAISYNIINDDSRTVRASLVTVIRSGIGGILMAVLIIFLFLNDARTTAIIALSIPLSIMFTFIGMKLAGMSVNLMSLSGIVVALGMIVDGSIVMIEEIFKYYKDRDKNGNALYTVEQAIFRGANEVGASIFASAATTIAVFIPVAMLTGIVGMVLKDVALTLIMAISASLISAVVVVPFLMRVLLKSGGPERHRRPFIKGFMEKLEKKYRSMLKWSLASRGFILFLALSVLIASVFIVRSVGVAFIPSTDNGDFFIDVDFPGGYPLSETERQLAKINDLLKANVPEVDSALFYSGQSQDFSGASGNVSNRGYVHVVLVPVAERKRNIHEIILQMQNLISKEITDVTVKVSNGGFDKLVGYVSGGGGYGLTLVSEDLRLLYDTASKIEDFLRDDPDVVSVSLDSSFDTDTLVIDMAHEYMSALGITSYEAGVTSAILFQGMDAGRFKNKSDGKRYDIRLFSDVTDKAVTKDDISNIQIVTQNGTPVSFANLSTVRTEQTVSKINHIDRAKKITVSATLVGEDTTGVNSRVKRYLIENPLPAGVSSQSGGIMELIEDAIPSLLMALAIAVFLVYTVMVLQFERFRQPLIIMISIPFCLIGVILGLLIFGSTMSILPLLGVISLGGIVVNNGIILIDYINLIRKRKADEAAVVDKRKYLSGLLSKVNSVSLPTATTEYVETEDSLITSILDGASSRLRPIFMTTLSTLLGVVPMAIASGEGAEIYAPLGQSIAGGLLTSTMITLFIIPVLYYMTERRKLKKSGKAVTKIVAEKPKKHGKQKAVGAAILFALVFIFMQSNVNAEETFTLEKFSALLEQNNSELRLAQEEYTRALLDVKDAKASYGPDISFTLGGGYSKSPLNTLQIDAGAFHVTTPSSTTNVAGIPVTIPPMTIQFPEEDTEFSIMPRFPYKLSLDMTQPIFTWGKLLNARKLFSAAAEAKRLRLEYVRKQLGTQLKATLTAIVYLNEMETLVTEQQQYSENLVMLSENAEKNGAIVKQDVLKARLQAQQIPVLKTEIQNRRNSLVAELCKMTGLSDIGTENIVYVPNETEFEKFKNISFDAMMYESLNESKQEILGALSYASEASSYAKKIANGDVYWKPDIALQASVGFSGNIEKLFKGQSKVLRDLTASVSLGITTTIWDGGKKMNEIKRQASNETTAAINKEKARREIEEELRKQYNSFQLSMTKVDYQNLKVEVARIDKERAETFLSSGYKSEKDLLQARIDFITANIELAKEKINLATAVYTLSMLTGF